MAQFAMVEELASLVKDNLHCKHLILSMEDKLVDFIQDDSSWSRVLELEPMNPYDRLLVHRLAEIYGFSHQSVGEGEDRHLVLERCPETSVPAILVGDLIWQLDEDPSPINFDILRREEGNTENTLPSERRHVSANEPSMEERKRAYLIARERIFSSDNRTSKQRPQNNAAVARRMITRALGKTDRPTDQNQRPCNNTKQREEDQNLRSESSSKVILQRDALTSDVNSSSEGQNTSRSSDEKALRKEHEGAAKRLFANALGVQPRGPAKQKQPTA